MGSFIPELVWNGTTWTGLSPSAQLAVTLDERDGAVLVQWNDVPTATGYRVSRNGTDTIGSGPWSVDVAAGTFELLFDKLINGTAYEFTVQSLPDGPVIKRMGTPSGSAPPPPPPPPASLTVTAVAEDSKITASWVYTGSAEVTGFLVGRNGTDSSGFGAWSTTDPATARSRVFDNLVNGQEYTITVQPLPGGTPVAVKKTPSAGPVTETTVTAQALDRQVRLSWLRVTDATGYRLGYTVGGVAQPNVEVGADLLTYTFQNLTNGTSHSFRVKPLPESLNSPEKTVTATPVVASTRKVPRVTKSGLPWNSIVFGHGAQPGAFETWRKRPVDGVLYWPARTTWAQMAQLPGRRSGDFMVYCIPPFPEGIGGSNAATASGAYDSNIRAWASALVNAGWNNNMVCIRLGWENNGTWYQWSWSNGGVQNWINAFRRFVQQSRAAGLTNVTWNWCLNKGTQAYNAGYSWTTAYPGDDVVDVIGIDSYDMYTPNFNLAQWNANINGKNPGMNDVAAFCRSHGKLMSIDEWGPVNSLGSNGGADNPIYIGYMFDWLKANADILAWENTYDHAGNPGWNHKLSDGSNPKSAARYRQPWPNGWGG